MRSPTILLVAASLAAAAPTTYVVSAQGGTHSSLQAAIDACPATGCRIMLSDSLYEFSEPVSIRGKANISIVGNRSNGARPILALSAKAHEFKAIPNMGDKTPDRIVPILWESAPTPDTLHDNDGTIRIRRYDVRKGDAGTAPAFLLAQGRTPDGRPDPSRPAGWLVSPYPEPAPYGKTYADVSGYPADNLGNLYAGLFNIDSSRRIDVEHLEFAGGRPIEAILVKLWAGQYSQMSCLAAISLFKSFRSRIVDCEFHGWSVGVRTYDANPGGLASDFMSTGYTFSQRNLLPLADPGRMGGHAIEGNLAHDNRAFVELQASWDLASEIRFNRGWNNGVTRLIVKGDSIPQFDIEWHRGGFVHLEDVMYPTNVIQGNTMINNSLDLGWYAWRTSNAQLAMDNIVVGQGLLVDWRELLTRLGDNERSNWFAGRIHQGYPEFRTDTIVPFCKNPHCEPLTPLWGSPTIDARLIGKGWLGDDLGAVWSTPRVPEPIRIQDQTLGFVTRSSEGWTVVLPVLVEASEAISEISIRSALTQKINLIAMETDKGLTGLGKAVTLDSLVGRPVSPGVNLIRFGIPAKVKDSVWRIEMTLQGIDDCKGKSVHSNVGSWIVRPLGKQLLVSIGDTASVMPGETVQFVVSAKDSLGGATTIPETPSLNATGWTVASTPAPAIAARAAATPSGNFTISAKAPDVEGISQVIFWAREDGRLQAIPGAIYVQVGDLPNRTNGNAVRNRPWRLAGISRTGTGWALRLQGADEASLSSALLFDATGRTLRLSGAKSTLNLPRLSPGAYFLRLGDRTQPFVLVP